MGSEYGHIILNLVVVLGLIIFLLYLLKKFKFAKKGGAQHIKIINMVPVGAKEKIILLEVNKAILLIGATPNHIETLYVFNELEALENKSVPAHFSEQLTALMK